MAEAICMLTLIKMATKKKIITNIALLLIVALILFVPAAKAVVIRGLMSIGLFEPAVETKVISVGKELKDIKFKNANGQVISLADCKGKVVFLNFWATWCPPCLAEMPAINRFYEQFKNQDVIFILVDADGNLTKSQAYLDRKKYKLPIYAMASDVPQNIFKGTLPTTLVLDRKGRISLHGEGAANYSSKQFTNFISELLKRD